MNVLAYCERVQLYLEEADVCPDQGLLHRLDRVRAKVAVRYAMEGNDVFAREIADDVAERWMLPV